MANISKHHSKQEGEGYDSEHCWVCLLEHWDSIGIYNFLKGVCELISLDIGWLPNRMIFEPSDFS